MITVTGSRGPLLGPLSCPTCGNRTDFDLTWLGDIPQRFAADAESGERDYAAYVSTGEALDIDLALECRQCGTLLAERDVAITVTPWQRLMSRVQFLEMIRRSPAADAGIASAANSARLCDEAEENGDPKYGLNLVLSYPNPKMPEALLTHFTDKLVPHRLLRGYRDRGITYHADCDDFVFFDLWFPHDAFATETEWHKAMQTILQRSELLDGQFQTFVQRCGIPLEEVMV